MSPKRFESNARSRQIIGLFLFTVTFANYDTFFKLVFVESLIEMSF